MEERGKVEKWGSVVWVRGGRWGRGRRGNGGNAEGDKGLRECGR